MPCDDRNVLQVLKSELDFVSKGGYGRSPRSPWRAQLIFEDSPSCMNYDATSDRAPCTACTLIQFVPQEKQAENVPCRYIQLTAEGETLLDLYNGGTQQELEDALMGWLRGRIAALEASEAVGEAGSGRSTKQDIPAPRVH